MSYITTISGKPYYYAGTFRTYDLARKHANRVNKMTKKHKVYYFVIPRNGVYTLWLRKTPYYTLGY